MIIDVSLPTTERGASASGKEFFSWRDLRYMSPEILTNDISDILKLSLPL
jgi:hypothetical protein